MPQENLFILVILFTLFILFLLGSQPSLCPGLVDEVALADPGKGVLSFGIIRPVDELLSIDIMDLEIEPLLVIDKPTIFEGQRDGILRLG